MREHAGGFLRLSSVVFLVSHSALVHFLFICSDPFVHLCVSTVGSALGCGGHRLPIHRPYCSSCNSCWRLGRCAAAGILCLIFVGHYLGDRGRHPCGLGSLCCCRLGHRLCFVVCLWRRQFPVVLACQSQSDQRCHLACCLFLAPCQLLDLA